MAQNTWILGIFINFIFKLLDLVKNLHLNVETKKKINFSPKSTKKNPDRSEKSQKSSKSSEILYIEEIKKLVYIVVILG